MVGPIWNILGVHKLRNKKKRAFLSNGVSIESQPQNTQMDNPLDVENLVNCNSNEPKHGLK